MSSLRLVQVFNFHAFGGFDVVVADADNGDRCKVPLLPLRMLGRHQSAQQIGV